MPPPKLHAWFDTPLGASLLDAEIKEVARFLPRLYGDYLVKIGGPSAKWEEFLATSSIRNKIYLTSEPIKNRPCTIQCHYHELPLLGESIDAIILHHALELSSTPYTILEETYHALAPAGHLIIIGFNPLSLWGIQRALRAIKDVFSHNLLSTNTSISTLSSPWHTHFISLGNLKRWLKQLNFIVTSTRTFYFRPPIAHNKFLKRMAFLENLGKFAFLPCGGCYILAAQKNIAAVPPPLKTYYTRHKGVSPLHIKSRYILNALPAENQNAKSIDYIHNQRFKKCQTSTTKKYLFSLTAPVATTQDLVVGAHCCAMTNMKRELAAL